MRFSANLSFLFPEISSTLEKYSAAHEAGFKGVECGDVYKHTTAELVAVLKETQLQQVLLNTFTGSGKGFAALPGKEEEFRSSLEISIEYCKALKCPRLHVLAGLYPQADGNENLIETYTKTFISSLKYASQRAASEGITLLIEPISAIPGYFLTRTNQAVDILEQVGCSNVKLQLDLYHHQRTHGRIVDTLKEHWKVIEHIQVAQVPGRHEPDEKGEINYKFVFDMINSLGYQGWIGCEYSPLQCNFDWMHEY